MRACRCLECHWREAQSAPHPSMREAAGLAGDRCLRRRCLSIHGTRCTGQRTPAHRRRRLSAGIGRSGPGLGGVLPRARELWESSNGGGGEHGTRSTRRYGDAEDCTSPWLRVYLLISSRVLRPLRSTPPGSQRRDDDVVDRLCAFVTVAGFDGVQPFVAEIVFEVLDRGREIPPRVDTRVHGARVIGE